MKNRDQYFYITLSYTRYGSDNTYQATHSVVCEGSPYQYKKIFIPDDEPWSQQRSIIFKEGISKKEFETLSQKLESYHQESDT